MEEKNLTGYPSIDKPWLKYYSEEEINTPLPEETIYEHVLKKNQDNLDRVCLSYYGTDITYREFFNQINDIASALENYGVKENDVVTVGMFNSPEYICLLFAISKIGAVANTIFPVSSPEELTKYIKETNSHIIITLDIFQDKYTSIIKDVKVDAVIVVSMTNSMSWFNKIGACLSGKIKKGKLPNDRCFVSWQKFLNASSGMSQTKHNSNAPVIINYTGGTTGGSKGVILSNKAVLAVAEQYITGASTELSRASTWVQVLPLFIAYGVTCSLMIPLCVGMKLIIRMPMAESISQLCKKFKPNHIMYGPAYWESFANANEKMDLSYLIAPITGGDILRGAAETKINEYFEKCHCPYKIMNGYGMTEVGAAVSVNFKDKYEFGSVGLPYAHNIISAFDPETGKELKMGKEGEICIHTPSVMLGYVNNEEETNNILRTHEDGRVWVHTGDLGYISEKGFIHISGRIKRYMLVIANGLHKKIYGLDIEKILLESRQIENCAVVPINDDAYNQVPVAFVVPKDADVKKDLLENELKNLCHDKLGDLYSPRKYYFVDKFPLTKVGKIDYLALEKLAEETK